MEVEGAALWVDLCPGYLPAPDGAGGARIALEDPPVVPRRHNCNRSRFRNSSGSTRRGLGRLRGAGLKLEPAKCELLQTKVGYLGHVVSQRGVSTDPEKIEAVAQWPAPKDLKELQTFLGTVEYYRQYIPGFATLPKPLTRLTGSKETWQWATKQQEAFEQLQRCLVTAPVLGYPDPKLPYVLDTDASNEGVGAVLSQVQDGEERVIGYYSKTLAPPKEIIV